MSKHTPGPWFPVRLVMRDLLGSGGMCQFMSGADGRPELFDTEEAASAAIAKAEGRL